MGVSTRSKVLVMSSLDVSNKVFYDQTKWLNSLQPLFLVKLSPLKCITNLLQKLDQETTLVLTSKVYQKKTCQKLEMLCLSKEKMVTTAHLLLQTPSELLFSSKTILDNLSAPSTEKEDSPHPSTVEPPKHHAKCWRSYGREENQLQSSKWNRQCSAKQVTKLKSSSNQRCQFVLMLMTCANL